MKVFRAVKAAIGVVADDKPTAPSPTNEDFNKAFGTGSRRESNEHLAAELQKTHSRVRPAPPDTRTVAQLTPTDAPPSLADALMQNRSK